MSRRVLLLLGVIAVVVVGTMLMRSGPAATGADAQSGVPGKTSWGDPDLQGLWTDEYQIPLQRPAKFAGKETLTDAEVQQLDIERAGKPSFGERRAAKGSEKDVAGAYNSEIFLTQRHTGKRTSLIIDPADGRIPPFTEQKNKENEILRDFYLGTVAASLTCKEKARGCEGGTYTPPSAAVTARRNRPHPYYPAGNGFPTASGGGYINRSDGPEDRGLSERCLGAVLPDFGGATGNVRAIVQSAGVVSMFYDTGQGQGWHRVIPVDGSSHPPASVRIWWGDSRGRWEGNTLVVDVTNFSRRTNYRGSRENLHLTEKWTRTGPDTLEYIVTMEDPTTWTRPWTVKQEYKLQSAEHNRVYKEPRCHEGNFGMIGMLGGERRIERAFRDGKGPDPSTINSVVPTNSALSDEELDDLQ
jgi:hypothetical protein